MMQPNMTAISTDPRSALDRRQRDGLGLLPRSSDRWERQRRQQLNAQVGWFLLALGLTIWASGLLSLVQTRSIAFAFGVAFGLAIAARGFQLATWNDRRVGERRRTDRQAANLLGLQSTSAPTAPLPLAQRRAQASLQWADRSLTDLRPPEID